MPYGQPRIPIAAYREKVQIQERVEFDDGSGGQTVKWQTIAEPHAAVLALDERTKEGLEGSQLTAMHAYHLAIRPWRAGIVPGMRVIVQDTMWEIHSVVDDEGKRRRLMLQCGQVQR